MAENHTVKQGENLARIAKQYGFKDINTIWEHPQNESLRNDRTSPDILYPGDVVHIPDKKPFKIKLSTNKVHTLVVRQAPPQVIDLTLKNFQGKAWRDQSFELVCGEQIIEGQLDHTGRIKVVLEDIDEPTAELNVFLKGADRPSHQFTLKLNELDPWDKTPGIKARCNALGFNCGPVDHKEDDHLASGIRRFQRSQAIEVTGNADFQTQFALMKQFGC